MYYIRAIACFLLLSVFVALVYFGIEKLFAWYLNLSVVVEVILAITSGVVLLFCKYIVAMFISPTCRLAPTGRMGSAFTTILSWAGCFGLIYFIWVGGKELEGWNITCAIVFTLLAVMVPPAIIWASLISRLQRICDRIFVDEEQAMLRANINERVGEINARKLIDYYEKGEGRHMVFTESYWTDLINH